MRRLITMLPVFFAAAGLGACAQTGKPAATLAHFKCVDAAADGVSFGRAKARSVARSALTQELPDSRGFLISSGVERVRVVSRRTDCRPYALSPAWTKCTAHARLCGS